MAIFDETRVVERLQFFNGQRLFASDLQGIEAFNREMRWLHNQSLHQPGIGNGFTVSGQKGDRQVSIGAGYAIDARRREIVLTQAHLTISRIASLPILLVTGAAVIAGGAGENLATGAQTSIFAEALDFAKANWKVAWLGVED